MTIARSFVKYLESKNLGVYGKSIFINAVPLDAEDKAFWIRTSGGNSIIKADTGEKVKNYLISVWYRNTSGEDVDTTLQLLEEEINSNNCVQLEDYDIIEIEASTFNADQDLDTEDRMIGVLEATLTVYQGA